MYTILDIIFKKLFIKDIINNYFYFKIKIKIIFMANILVFVVTIYTILYVCSYSIIKLLIKIQYFE